jgi:hypothetical protein
MPDRHGKLADVRPAYGRGDRVLVRLPLCYYVLVIHASDLIDGEVWFYGKGVDIIMPFPAACVVRRLSLGEDLAGPEPT